MESTRLEGDAYADVANAEASSRSGLWSRPSAERIVTLSGLRRRRGERWLRAPGENPGRVRRSRRRGACPLGQLLALMARRKGLFGTLQGRNHPQLHRSRHRVHAVVDPQLLRHRPQVSANSAL